MSIASPRPSLNLPSSRRTSSDTINSTRSPSSSRAPSILNVPSQPQPRRNRAALREFYNLQPSSNTSTTSTSTLQPDTSTPEPDALSPLDSPNFSAQTYVSSLLQTSDPKSLLKTLNQVTVSALGLEGDKKALVYDNYTTLLSATGTISRMRENVDPMAPVTTTLEPAVGYIVDVAAGIAGRRGGGGQGEKSRGGRERQKETVRWVLGAPERLRTYMEQGKEEEATKEWEEVKTLLVKWEGVSGVKEVREACEEVMKEGKEG